MIVDFKTKEELNKEKDWATEVEERFECHIFSLLGEELKSSFQQDVELVTNKDGEPFCGFAYYKDGNGRVKEKVRFHKGLKQGTAKTYDENGKLFSEEDYDHGVLDGYSRQYYPNGRIFSEVYFTKGIRSSEIKCFDEKGDIVLDADGRIKSIWKKLKQNESQRLERRNDLLHQGYKKVDNGSLRDREYDLKDEAGAIALLVEIFLFFRKKIIAELRAVPKPFIAFFVIVFVANFFMVTRPRDESREYLKEVRQQRMLNEMKNKQVDNSSFDDYYHVPQIPQTYNHNYRPNKKHKKVVVEEKGEVFESIYGEVLECLVKNGEYFCLNSQGEPFSGFLYRKRNTGEILDEMLFRDGYMKRRYEL